jgi:hypothetical protein
MADNPSTGLSQWLDAEFVLWPTGLSQYWLKPVNSSSNPDRPEKEESMKLPVDTSAIAFLCAVEAEPVIDFETRRPKADENGEPLYAVQLIAMTDGAAEILAVKVPGMPSGIRQGHPVKVTGLVAQPWSMNDRSGVAFRAARIEPAIPAAKAS